MSSNDDRGSAERGELPQGFGVLLSAAGVSGIGTGVTTVALPLLAASLTNSVFQVSLVTFASRLPWLGPGLFSGAIVDRFDQRAVMVRIDLLRGIIQLGLCLLVTFGLADLTWVAVCAFLLGCGDTFFGTATLAVVPTMAAGSRPVLERANSMMQTVRNTTRYFAGSAIGGLLFTFGRMVPAGVDGLSFLASSTVLRLLPPMPPVEAARGASSDSPVVRTLGMCARAWPGWGKTGGCSCCSRSAECPTWSSA